MTTLCLIFASLLCLTPARAVLWSSLGILADGRTDNTASLNALPPGVAIEGDCPQGGAILAQGVWYLRSQLQLRVQAGCEVLSNATGLGSYAISQRDPSVPLSNVSLVGLTISKTSRAEGDRVLLAYIDNFQLLNWTFHHHGGAMFLRGSCQEVAYGRSFDAAPQVGSPGIRHIGNLPKAQCLRPQPANVWVHHNSIASGDGAYQACQPLAGALWPGVSSDDLLFEASVGSSSASAFILVGLHNTPPQHSDFSCTNVTFQGMQGSGLRLIYVQAAAAPNLVAGVVLRDLQLQVTPYFNYTPASIQLTAVWGGVVRSVLMDGVRALGTLQTGLNATGALEDMVFTNGELAAPAAAATATVSIDGGASAVLSHSLIGAPAGGVRIGAASATQGTVVLNCTLAGVGPGSAGISLGNANGSTVTGNHFSALQGARSTTGIELGAATTFAGVHLNDVRTMATGIVCGPRSSNNVSGNPGAADC